MPATVSPIAAAGGRNHYLVDLSETGARDTTEITISGLPQVGTIVWMRAKRTAGTGATVHPRLGTSAGFVADSYDQVAQAVGTAADLVEASTTPYCAASGILYWRSGWTSSNTDHAMTAQLLIVAGGQ